MKLMSEHLPEGWSRKRIDDLGKLYSGATPSTHIASYWGDEIVWVTPNDLSTLRTRHIEESERQITALGLQNCSAHLLPKGSLIISSRAPIGYLAIAQTEFCTNQGCKSLVFSPDHDPDFHYYNLLFRVRAIREKGEGTTFAEISKTALASIEVPVPDDKSEQTAIADILTTVDRAIEQTEALIAKQRRIKAGLLHDLLTRGIDEHGHLRDPSTHRFKPSPVGLVPEEWEVVRVKDVCHLGRGRVISQQEIDLHPGTYPVYSSQSKDEGAMGAIDTFDYDGEYVTWTTDGAYAGTVFFRSGQFNCTNVCGTLKAISHDLNMCFLALALSMVTKKHVSYVGNPKLMNNIMAEIQIALPCKTEQDVVSRYLSTIDQRILDEQATLGKLQRVKIGLMRDLLSGRVSVAGLARREMRA